MAELPNLTDFYNLFGNLLTSVNVPSFSEQASKSLQSTLEGVVETAYPYSENKFPDNLGTEQNGHLLKIEVLTGGATGGSLSPPSNNVYNAYLFIPGAAPGESMPLIYDQQHNFTDIRLTNIVNDSLLGITVQMATNRQLNPMVQVLYRSTNLRQFDFSFLMVPKNEKESQSIENIVRKIRAYAAPEFISGTVIAPAEFKFKFFNHKMQEAPHLPKIGRCVVTKVTANFAPPGTFTTFRNGYPTSCLLTFSATEVEIIDRTMIQQQGF